MGRRVDKGFRARRDGVNLKLTRVCLHQLKYLKTPSCDTSR